MPKLNASHSYRVCFEFFDQKNSFAKGIEKTTKAQSRTFNDLKETILKVRGKHD